MSPAYRSLRRVPSTQQAPQNPQEAFRYLDHLPILNPPRALRISHGDPSASLQLRGGSRGTLLTQVTEPLQSVSTFKNSASNTSSDVLLRIFFTALMKPFMSSTSKQKKEHHPHHGKSLAPSAAAGFSGVGHGGRAPRESRLLHCPLNLIYLFGIQSACKCWLHAVYTGALRWPHSPAG